MIYLEYRNNLIRKKRFIISSQASMVRRNVVIMWFANFFVSGSLTMVLPFLSLYIDSLGDFSESYVQTWSGYVFGITFVTAFFFSPIWGRIGDKYGRKKILIFSASGLALSVLLMGYASSVFELFLLRLLMGVFTGFIPMSQALISVQTPKEIAGRVLGTLQTGSITGTLLGPILGGTLADQFGFAATFKGVSFTIFLSAIIVLFGIKEMQVTITDVNEKNDYSRKEVFLHIFKQPILLIVMLLSMLIQIAHFSIQPILSLYVAEINGPNNIAFYSGLAFSAGGIGNLFMARRWGMLGDRVGHTKVIIALLFLTGLVYLPGAWVTSLWQLIILRFLVGVTLGGIIPVRLAYLRKEAPVAMQGEVIGYNMSLQFLGNVAGPALGGIIAGMFGIASVFYATSGLLVLGGVIMLLAVYNFEYKVKKGSNLSTYEERGNH